MVKILISLLLFSTTILLNAETKKKKKKVQPEEETQEEELIFKQPEKNKEAVNKKEETKQVENSDSKKKEDSIAEKPSKDILDKSKIDEKPKDEKEITLKLPDISVGIFGFIKADYVYSNQAMLSFGRENLTAPNQAKRVVQNDDRDSRSLFSMRETSIGFKPKFGNNLSSVIQFDLMDVNQGNGGLAGKPRIVQAFIEYKFTNKLELFAGQKWDIFSPLYPDTYNIISGLLGSGNLGWFREQIGLKHSIHPKFDILYSIGNSNLNTTPNVSPNVELTKAPTFAFQIKFLPTSDINFYLSGIYSNLKHNEPSYNARYLSDDYFFIPISRRVNKISQGISLGFEYKPTKKFSIRGEGHYGRNLDNLSLLSLSTVQVATLGQKISESSTPFAFDPNSNPYSRNIPTFSSTKEAGAWVSFLYNITPEWELIGLTGKTQILNPGDLNSASVQSGSTGNTRPLNLNQTNVDVWGSDQLGAVISNSSLGGSIARVFEGNMKLFFYYQYTETEYRTSFRQKGIFRYIDNINAEGRITLNNSALVGQTSSDTPHAHLIRSGVMMTF
ncbi:MAG: hypothetical protein SFU98_10565 [Leptospiraceae bacterium]|nr:hypothetical protein [Leptospiraceae bacterium]